MPQRVTCSGCGYVLYEGFELKPPVDVIQKYNGHCPRCNKVLTINVDSTEVKKVNKT